MFVISQLSSSHVLHRWTRTGVLLVCVSLSGCSADRIEYRENHLHTASLLTDSTSEEIESVASRAKSLLETILGSPDEPKWPEAVPVNIDMEKVFLASGPVGRNEQKIERGLFRKHCVQCHGISGDGFGPAAALLSPYPRDFRRGSFKFKSSPIGKKPIHADIVRTIEFGLPGTAMPAFKTLNESEEFAGDVDALAHYVRFLSIRGEVERRLIASIVEEEIEESTPIQLLAQVAKAWSVSEPMVMPRPTLGQLSDHSMRGESIARGKRLFESELTACIKCHGSSGGGNGTSQDFDDWTKDWTIRAGIDPTKKSEWKPMKKYGALKPVIDPARNLGLGVFRGGSSREDILKRLVLGIEGSPMPAVARKENENPGLTDGDLCDLVEYVCSLSDGKSTPKGQQEANDVAVK